MKLSFDDNENNRSLSKFESMLKTNKVFFFDSEEFENIICYYIDTGRINLAKKALKIGLNQHPQSTDLQFINAEILILENKLEKAEKIIKKLQKLEPHSEDVYIFYANIASKRNEHKKAISFLKEALKHTEEEAELYSLIGMEYLFLDELENAKTYYIKSLEVDASDYSALYNVIYCFDFLEQNNEAITYLETFIDKNPYNEIAWHQLGRQFHLTQKYKKAVWAFDYATLIDESFIGGYLEKAKSLEKLKKYNEAIACYLITLELGDANSFTLLRLAKCHERLNKKDIALKYYHKAIHEDPLLDKAWVAITDYYIRQEKYKKALYYINKAIEIDAENGAYWKKYGTINNALGLYKEANIGYKKAFDYGYTDINTFIYWVNILQVLDEKETAISILLEASEVFPNEFKIEYRLAGLHYLNNNSIKGNFHLSTALQLNPKGISILKDFFPNVWKLDEVQEKINLFLK